MDIDIADIIPHMGNLSAADQERIMASDQTRGSTAGAQNLLLELSRCAGETWFVDFMVALREGNYHTLADKFVEGYHNLKKGNSDILFANLVTGFTYILVCWFTFSKLQICNM